MNFFKKLSIKNKLVTIILLVSILTGIFGTVTVTVVNSKFSKKKMLYSNILLAKLIAEQSITAVDFGNKTELNELLSKLKANEEIEHCHIYDKNGQLLATFNKTNSILEKQTLRKEPFSEFSNNQLTISEPIVFQNQFLGSVLVQVSTASLQKSNNQFIASMVVIMGLIAIISFIIASVIQKYISKPILELAETTTKLAETSNYDISIKKQTEDEIGILYDKFNEMVFQLKTKENERNKAIEEKISSEEKFKKMSETSFDAIIAFNMAGKITFWNYAASAIFGYSEEEIIGKEIHKYLLDGIFQKQFEKELAVFAETHTSNYLGRTFEINLKRNDKKSFPVELTIIAFEHRNEWQAFTTIRDITERKNNESALIDAKRKAEESDRLKSAFLANMSHEIRTPMNAIIGFSELLTKPQIFEEQREKFLKYIIASGKSLLTLINDIIDVSKIEAGQLKIMIEPCNINSILSEIYTSFYETLNFQKNNLELRLVKTVKDSDFIITTDGNRLKQILNNLLSNAFKFTDEGFIEFGYKFRNKNEILFYVQDTGIGIPDDKKQIIFERFGQVEETYNKNLGGTGLGLSISKKIAELLGGTLWVESTQGKGSIFYFGLPHDVPETAYMQIDTNIGNEIFDWSEKIILVAEDEDMNYLYLEELLSQTKAKLIWVKDGKGAVDFVNKQHVDIILMDIKMPGMDGLEATRLIKKTHPKIPIIAQTAYAMVGEKEKSLEAGCDEYLIKPLKIETVLATINYFLNK